MEAISCPSCGGPFDPAALRAGVCRWCGGALAIGSLAILERHEPPVVRTWIAHYAAIVRERPTDPEALLALALCHLRLGLLPGAEAHLSALVAAHPAEPAGYFYQAVASMQGKRPRQATLSAVRAARTLLGTSVELDPTRGVYELCRAAIDHDYCVTNGMRVPDPDPVVLLRRAASKALDAPQVAQLLAQLKIPDGPFRALCLSITGC